MKTLFYSTKDFEKQYIIDANADTHEITLIPEALSITTAIKAKGFEAISIFTGDDASTEVIRQLKQQGVKYIAIRATGYDNVDIHEAERIGISVANVPAYSPHSIAEHAVGLMLALCRKLTIANEQAHHHNFTVGNLVGFDLHGKTVGIIGTGKIGSVVVKILHGFGCNMLGYDINHDNKLVEKYGLKYVSLTSLFNQSDIITIHTDLNKDTKYLINKTAISSMKKNVMLINTARGGIINTADLIEALENKTIGCAGLDVYEKERGLFFFDHSNDELQDEMLKKLLNMSNVLITPHQAFATTNALSKIASTTFYNLDSWQKNSECVNELTSSIDLNLVLNKLDKIDLR